MDDTPIGSRQKTEGRDAAGRFTRGNRASPGRPPGRSQATLLRERLALQVLLVQLHRRPPLQALHQRQRSRLLSP